MKRLLAGLLLVAIMLGTVACAEAQSPVAMETEVAESSGVKGGITIPDIEIPPASVTVSSAPGVAPVPSPVPGPMVPTEEPSYSSYDEEGWSGERMIVRTGDMSLVVTDVAAAMEQIAELAGDLDGYVVSSNSWRQDDRLVGYISIRVASGNFNTAVSTLRALAVEVNSESTSSTDVTEEYIDLSARLHNLEASEAQLLELMKQAGSVEEILEVQRELTDTREDIEQTKGRMQYLEQTSSTSLLNISLEQAALDVSFTANNRTVKVGQTVYFEPSIGGGISPYSYEWDFGDGTTSTDAVVTHTYKSQGSYNVVLKVTDDRGQVASKERNNYIDVLPGWSAGNVASSAWSGLATFGRGLANLLIWLGIFSPVWIVIGVILYFAWWRRRKKKG